MNKTVIQIPIEKDLRVRAEHTAEKAGFSSVQEAVRVFLTQFTNGTLRLTFSSEPMLSKTAEKRYVKMVEEIMGGNNIASDESFEKLLK